MTDENSIRVPSVSERDDRPDDVIIETEGLTKRFGDTTAVQDVSFYVPRGSIFGFIGPSGSGKTTTIRMLTGYLAPTEGEARVLGVAPTKFTRSKRQRIGYMPQLFVLYPNLSVWENISFAASMYSLGFRRSKRLNAMLDFVELQDHKGKLAREISGGMQRRLTLAATLVHNPDLLFLDEPTAGVDPVLRSKFWERFRELRDGGRTLFVTTQYVSEAAYCDLVAVMGEGKIITVNTPERLRYNAYGGDMVDLRTSQPLDAKSEYLLRNQPFVKRRIRHAGDRTVRIVVDEASTAIPEILDWCKAQNIEVESIEEYQPPFDDVFVELIQEDRKRE